MKPTPKIRPKSEPEVSRPEVRPVMPVVYSLMAVGVMLNSALYLVAVVAAGFLTAHPKSWKLGIAALGVTYLSYVLNISTQNRPIVVFMFMLTILLGAGAGITLLF